jgi:hypothetical protein
MPRWMSAIDSINPTNAVLAAIMGEGPAGV